MNFEHPNQTLQIQLHILMHLKPFKKFNLLQILYTWDSFFMLSKYSVAWLLGVAWQFFLKGLLCVFILFSCLVGEVMLNGFGKSIAQFSGNMHLFRLKIWNLQKLKKGWNFNCFNDCKMNIQFSYNQRVKIINFLFIRESLTIGTWSERSFGPNNDLVWRLWWRKDEAHLIEV